MLEFLLTFLMFWQKPVAVDFEILKNCQTKYIDNPKKNTDCFKNYFSDFTDKNGRDKAILAFQKLVKKDQSFTENCHYILHGIGHGTLLNLKNNIGLAFSISLQSPIMQALPPTCASGYFHGLIEEYAGETNDIKLLEERLKNVCENKLVKENNNQIDCYHGIGHAIYMHLDDNLKQTISFCEHITANENMMSMCRTGVFMEMLRGVEYPPSRKGDKMLTFAACENLAGKYQGECFNQQSYLLAEFGTKKEEFNTNIKLCQNKFPKKLDETNTVNLENRISCIRMFSF